MINNIIYADELRQYVDEWLNSKEFEVWHGNISDLALFAAASWRKFAMWLELKMMAHSTAEKP